MVHSGLYRPLVIGTLVAGAIALGGCSSDKVRDAFGLTKDSPNENLVRVNRPLALPPDYVLRAPNAGDPVRETGYKLPPSPNVAASLPPAGSVPAPLPPRAAQAYPPASPLPPAGAGGYRPPQGPLQTAAPIQTASVQPGQPAAPYKRRDLYDMWGISKTNPDGTPKTQEQLRVELRAKYLAKKKAEDPKWGTWKNFWKSVLTSD